MHDTLGSMLFLTTAEMLACISRKTRARFHCSPCSRIGQAVASPVCATVPLQPLWGCAVRKASGLFNREVAEVGHTGKEQKATGH